MKTKNWTEEANRAADAMRTYLSTSGAEGYVVGLSGGIDSAVTAALAVRAVGRDRVKLVILPCKSPEADAIDGKAVADMLRVPAEVIRLDEAYNALTAAAASSAKNPLTAANMKSRLRMVALYAQANERNYLVAGTSNKSEILLGYYTKYGDGGVDVEPIGRFYKSEVYALARELNIPEQVQRRPPSASLWDGQTDEDELGMTYDQIEAACRALDGENVEADASVIRRVQKIASATEHKRQMPMTLR